MFCPNCGAQLPDGSAFCGSCGAKLGGAQPQQQYQQPQYQQPQQQYQPQYAYQPQPQKKSKLPLILAGVGIVAAIAVAVPILGGILGGEKPPEEYRPGQSGGISSVTLNDGKGGSYVGSNSGSSSSTGSQVDSSTSQYENWLLTGNTGTGGGAGGMGGTGTGGVSSAASMSTDRLPQEADFDWFYNRETGTCNASVPAGATLITDNAAIDGGWMCFIMRNPMTAPHRQYWNMELTVKGNSVTAVQHWSGDVPNGGSFEDASAANDNDFFGDVDVNNILTLHDYYGSELAIIQWYEYEGKQYGLGTYQPGWGDEELGLAAFCR